MFGMQDRAQRTSPKPQEVCSCVSHLGPKGIKRRLAELQPRGSMLCATAAVRRAFTLQTPGVA